MNASSFLLRAGSVKEHGMKVQEANALIKELSRNPQLRDLGWVVCKKPNSSFNEETLSIGHPSSRTQIHLDKSTIVKTDRILTKLGWSRSQSNQNRLWCYQKSLSEISSLICLTWTLSSPLRTEVHPMGKMQYPIQHMQIYVEFRS